VRGDRVLAGHACWLVLHGNVCELTLGRTRTPMSVLSLT